MLWKKVSAIDVNNIEIYGDLLGARFSGKEIIFFGYEIY